MTDCHQTGPGGCDRGCDPRAGDRRTVDCRARARDAGSRRPCDRRTRDRRTVDRRTFVARTVGALAAVALPLACVPPVLSVRPRHGMVVLDLTEHPSLSEPGGFLRLQPTGRVNPVYVLALADGEYAALSSTCTHQGCTVGVQGDRLVCPCHGSTYDRRGRVLRGPAPDPLRSFPAETDEDGTLRITLEDG